MRSTLTTLTLLVVAIFLCPQTSHAQVYSLTATIDGLQPVSPTGSGGTGSATMTFDTVTQLLSWNISWSGLSGPSVAMHFHGPAAPGANAGVQVPIVGLTSPSIGSAVISAGQATDLLNDLYYINIHTSQFPGGEIRGQVIANDLPVELAHFDARVEGRDARLAWQTLSETNNAGFEIQHAVDLASDLGQTWHLVDFVEGHGTTTEQKIYAYTVSGLDPGTHAFRLKQIDLDGSFAYSPVVEVVSEIPDRAALFPAYPNPFNPVTRLKFAVASEQPVQAVLYSATGRLVKTLYRGTPTSGVVYDVTVKGDELPSGLYLVRLEGASFAKSQAILLSK